MDRALLFIDGNNWYHACKACGVKDRFALSYVAVSRKLVDPRTWVGTRYYIGALKQTHRGYREQRQFLSRLQNSDPRISVHLGRIEERPQVNELARELLQYLTTVQLEPEVRLALENLAAKREFVSLLKEKAADVMLAVEMYKLAVEDAYDAAYLLSADGDFTPAVHAVMDLGKKVYCVSPLFSAALKNASSAFIPLVKDWFNDCYRFS
ncbi:MAG TPA: NYN domain-containing protein [Thermoanaerobaculia bacterium]|nr:NYN domain-containing protein [Thermoanaerobaculia bacterium]